VALGDITSYDGDAIVQEAPQDYHGAHHSPGTRRHLTLVMYPA
jgi:hypothetical protein